MVPVEESRNAVRLMTSRLHHRLNRMIRRNYTVDRVMFVALDIARFAKTDGATQSELRRRLYGAVQIVKNNTASSTYEVLDRGDGVLVLLPDRADLMRLLETAIPAVARKVREDNEKTPATAMQLRCVVHKGRAQRDRWGWVGQEINLVFRLIDSPALRQRLKKARTPLVVALSRAAYDEALSQFDKDEQRLHNQLKPTWEDEPKELPVRVKETREFAWVAAVAGGRATP